MKQQLEYKNEIILLYLRELNKKFNFWDLNEEQRGLFREKKNAKNSS